MTNIDLKKCGDCKNFRFYDTIEYDCPEDMCGNCHIYNEVMYLDDIACDDYFEEE